MFPNSFHGHGGGICSNNDHSWKRDGDTVMNEVLAEMVENEVIEICKMLKENGKECYLVGGATRDILMGLEPKDWDITTDATPDEVQKIFKNEKVIPTGIEHGTVTVLKGGEPFEITTFRTEGKYSDGRHPDYVKFTRSIQEDLQRRDLTINAIALDPLNGRIVTTPNDGLSDIRNRVIRAVGDPAERFREDGLRPLRVCRFASRLAFDIDEATKEAIKENLDVLDNISAERIRDEIMSILKQSEKPSIGFECLRETGLLDKVLPELVQAVGVEQTPQHHNKDVYYHTLAAVDSIPKDQYMVRLAALFHDVGKPRKKTVVDGRIRFIGHDEESARMTVEIMERLKFSGDEIKQVHNLVKNHMVNYSGDWTDKAVRKFVNAVGEESVPDLIRLAKADTLATKHTEVNDLESLEDRIRLLREQTGKAGFTARDLAVNGSDVMQYLNIPPSPEVGKIINSLVDKVMEDPSLNTKENLFRMMGQSRGYIGTDENEMGEFSG